MNNVTVSVYHVRKRNSSVPVVDVKNNELQFDANGPEVIVIRNIVVDYPSCTQVL